MHKFVMWNKISATRSRLLNLLEVILLLSTLADGLNCILHLDYKSTLSYEGINNTRFLWLEVCNKKVGFKCSVQNSFTFGL